KTIGCPAALLVLGLFFNLPATRSPLVIGVMLLVTSAAALMHSGTAEALFLCVAMVPYLATRWVVEQRSKDAGTDSAQWPADLGDRAVLAAILIGIAVVSSGVLARPVQTRYPDWGLDWNYVLPRALDLENQ